MQEAEEEYTRYKEEQKVRIDELRLKLIKFTVVGMNTRKFYTKLYLCR